MAEWSLIFTDDAEDDFNKLDKRIRLRVAERLNWLKTNFQDITPLALGGEWQGYFKLRVGDWRVIYKLDWLKNLLIVYAIDRRDKIYKERR